MLTVGIFSILQLNLMELIIMSLKQVKVHFTFSVSQLYYSYACL